MPGPIWGTWLHVANFLIWFIAAHVFGTEWEASSTNLLIAGGFLVCLFIIGKAVAGWKLKQLGESPNTD